MIVSKKNILKIQSGETVTELLGSRTSLGGVEHISCSSVLLSPNVRTEEHFHNTFDELHYVIKGRGVAVVSGIKYAFAQGDCFLVQKEEAHFLINGDEESEIIVVCTPAWNASDWFPLKPY